jgi:hypothetical protein
VRKFSNQILWQTIHPDKRDINSATREVIGVRGDIPDVPEVNNWCKGKQKSDGDFTIAFCGQKETSAPDLYSAIVEFPNSGSDIRQLIYTLPRSKCSHYPGRRDYLVFSDN